MSNQPKTLLGQYHYSALDTLSTCTLGEQPSSQRFYLKQRLVTEIQGALRHSVMQHEGQLLAQQQHQAGTLHTHLLATDQQRSVLALLDATRHHLVYSSYGHRAPENGLLSLLGFNGERPDPLTGCYLLGNGYRAFNPVLMRFNSPDYLSPFGKGGLNAYGYCAGDPVNHTDPSGHIKLFGLLIKKMGAFLGMTKQPRNTSSPAFSGMAKQPGNTARVDDNYYQMDGYIAARDEKLFSNDLRLKQYKELRQHIKNDHPIPEEQVSERFKRFNSSVSRSISPSDSPLYDAPFKISKRKSDGSIQIYLSGPSRSINSGQPPAHRSSPPQTFMSDIRNTIYYPD